MPSRAVLLSQALDQPLLERAERALEENGTPIEAIRALSEQPAALELTVDGPAEQSRAVLRPLTDEAAVDLAVADAPDGGRFAPGVLVMDVDSTLVAGEVIDSLAAYAGKGPEVAAVTERAMRGELDFAASLRERVAVLRGLPVTVLDEVRGALQLTPGARTLIATMQARGCAVGALSGGFIQILGPLADELDLDYAAANLLEVQDGVLTGRVEGPIVDRAEKLRCLRELAEQTGTPMEHTVAIGDGANDLDMITAAGLGIAFCAKPVVREQSPATISSGRLDDALLLLGIGRAEWVEVE